MNKILFGIMTILFNSLGIPCFMAGKVGAGIWRIILDVVINVLVIGIPVALICGLINFICGIVAGIKILTMSNEDFEACDKATLLKGIPSGRPKAAAEDAE